MHGTRLGLALARPPILASLSHCLVLSLTLSHTFTLALTTSHSPPQLFARYYMKFTSMSADQVEAATCRDTFMTPEQAVEAGLIDDVYTVPGDNVTPPAVIRGLEELGFVDRLSGGILRSSRV